ncbi:SDR family oxidoreductase [Hydrotalea sp.]|uniref:SDR family oxidoreductase n=1 Tax=Hydrotalea sp. TaxID=2881279 RepID=UPI003D0E2C49
MRILITGSNGFVGSHWVQYCLENNINFLATGSRHVWVHSSNSSNYSVMNLTDAPSINDIVECYAPTIIVHAAALSKPDECHTNRENALDINVLGTDRLLQAAKKLSHPVHFVYVSTDFVFGEDGPHSEEGTKNPLNFYGATKLMAEQRVIESGLPYTIIRPSFIYGKSMHGVRKDFLHAILEQVRNGQPVNIVNDQFRTPTYIEDFCRGLHFIIQQNSTGIFHISGCNYLTPYQMVIEMLEFLKIPNILITPVTGENFKEPVVRAKKGGLNIQKAQRILHYEPTDFSEALKLIFIGAK